MVPVALDVFCEALIQLPSAIPLRTISATGPAERSLIRKLGAELSAVGAIVWSKLRLFFRCSGRRMLSRHLRPLALFQRAALWFFRHRFCACNCASRLASSAACFSASSTLDVPVPVYCALPARCAAFLPPVVLLCLQLHACSVDCFCASNWAANFAVVSELIGAVRIVLLVAPVARARDRKCRRG